MNEYSYCLYYSSNLDKIFYRKSPCKVVEQLWVIWKSVLSDAHFVYRHEWNSACVFYILHHFGYDEVHEISTELLDSYSFFLNIPHLFSSFEWTVYKRSAHNAAEHLRVQKISAGKAILFFQLLSINRITFVYVLCNHMMFWMGINRITFMHLLCSYMIF